MVRLDYIKSICYFPETISAIYDSFRYFYPVNSLEERHTPDSHFRYSEHKDTN